MRDLSTRNQILYRLIAIIILLSALILLWVMGSRIFINPGRVMGQDFTLFWAAGRLTLAGQNPYDPVQMQLIREQVAGESNEEILTTLFFNPPWSIPLTLPFSVLPYLQGRLFWLIVNIIVLLISVHLLWDLYGGARRKVRIAWLALFTFGPTYLVLSLGQMTPIVLLGLVGFLYFIDRQGSEWLAGMFAALISIKPQLVFLFWPALLLWVVTQHRWKVLISLGLTILVLMLVSNIFNPAIITQYLDMLKSNSLMIRITPTIGVLLRLLFGIEKYWLQYMPSTLGIIWLAWYWIRHRVDWLWKKDVAGLIFVSLLTTPFGWTYDQIILIVTLIPAWINITQSRTRYQAIVLLTPLLLVNLVYLMLHREYTDQYFIWFAPAIFIWWWAIEKLTSHSSSQESAA